MRASATSPRLIVRLLLSVAWVLPTSAVLAAEAPLPEVVEFNRDIRPILSGNCFQCHGPDENYREADLRLDLEEGLLGDGGPIVAGKPDESELLRRISSTDEAEVMPPADSGKQLSPRQIALVRRWIEQGAKWQGHWAYIAPKRPPLPPVSTPDKVVNDIDRFILARLEQEGLAPAHEADRATLIRRLHFDLIGLPPTPEEVDAFVNDRRPDAYQRLVERLLASPHYGERMAIYWLDLVRFADTIGYHSDNPRNIAPYRDWVIRAFNVNLPFDQFTIEQLAGDQLPQATLDQQVASGYNRLLMTTEEGGAQPKEYAAKYMADRVRNASSVWLGSTVGCAECHDHKFDPFTTRDFYSFAAFFADIRENPVGRREPGLLLATPQQQAELKRLDEQIAALKKKLDTPSDELTAAQQEWERGARSGKEPKEILDILKIEPAQRNEAQQQKLAAYYRTIAPLLQPLRDELAKVEQQRNALHESIPKSLVTLGQTPATIRVLPRGNWMDDSGEVVEPAVPAFLPALDVGPRRANRLDLARWIVSRDNPLTARVYVNRLWKMFYGQGLSNTLDDLGSQGEWPTHPGLLDWLAVEFMDSGWDTKHLVRLMVTSGTYRQTSYATPEQKQRDPYNRLLARQARFRVDAEVVHDNALAISGLLVRRIGGESVKPYQPEGYWEHLNFPKRTYQHDAGANQYRRGLYTHWQRTFLHPSLLAFDAPSREECTADRPRSNTPQQALVLLNDPTYVEAARVFAARVLREGGSYPSARIEWAFRQTLGRHPSQAELEVLQRLYEKHRGEYASDPQAASQVASVGEFPVSDGLDAVELAAWTSVCRALLNLHETITRH